MNCPMCRDEAAAGKGDDFIPDLDSLVADVLLNVVFDDYGPSLHAVKWDRPPLDIICGNQHDLTDNEEVRDRIAEQLFMLFNTLDTPWRKGDPWPKGPWHSWGPARTRRVVRRSRSELDLTTRSPIDPPTGPALS